MERRGSALQKALVEQIIPASSTAASSGSGGGGEGSESALSSLTDRDKDGHDDRGMKEYVPVAATAPFGDSPDDAPKTGKVAYRNAVQNRLLPALRAFNPSLILYEHRI